MELKVAGQVLLYDLWERQGQNIFPRHHSQQAPWKGTYLGLFHGTVPLHHTTVLVNEELPRHGVLAEEAPVGPLQEGWGQATAPHLLPH